MTLVQKEPKNIKIGTTDVKRVMLGSRQVRPVWKPGADTIAYYPLTSQTTVNDMSGNSRNLTSAGSVSFGSYSGVDCCYINVGMLQSNIPALNVINGCTLNIWYCEAALPNNDNGQIMMFTTGNIDYIHGPTRSKGRPNGKYGIIGFFDLPITSTTPATVVTNTRYNVVQTYIGQTLSLYVNGNLIGTVIGTETYPTKNYVAISRSVDMDRSIKGYVSNYIVENKARTAQEISDYYNQTKANYGL